MDYPKHGTGTVMVSVGKRNAKKKYGDEFILFDRRKTKIIGVKTSKGNHEKKNSRNKTKPSFNQREAKNKTKMEDNMTLQKDILKHVTSFSGKGIKKNKDSKNLASHQNHLTKGLSNEHAIAENVAEIRDVFRCNTCNGCFLWKKPFLDHLIIHPCKLPYECCMCMKRFSTFISYLTHKQKIHVLKSSSSWSKLKHKKPGQDGTHSLFPSDQSNQHFMNMYKLLKHKVKTHLKILQTKAKPYACKPCGKSFKDRNNLWLHKKRHPNAVKPYKCDLCNREFAVHRWLSDHMQRHTVERNFPCGLCGKKYLTLGDVRMHERRHTKLAIFICSYCDRKFIYQSELKAHLQKHQGIRSNKNIKCEMCSKAFSTRRDLGRHLTVHTGAKPFKCEICEKSFSQEINMQVHIKIHRGDKPYRCDICPKKFIAKSKLVRHQRCHSTPKGLLPRPFQCILCPKKYTAENSLIRHLKIHKSSPETVTKFTTALTKALEDSKKPDSSASAGGVLASMIDQAICDARQMARRKKLLGIKDPSLATIIDQAIHNSIPKSSSSSSTQTQIEVDEFTTHIDQQIEIIHVDTQLPSSSSEDSVPKLPLDSGDRTSSTDIPRDASTCSYLLKLISDAVSKSNNPTRPADCASEKLPLPMQFELISSGSSQTVTVEPKTSVINTAPTLSNSYRQMKHRRIVSLNQRAAAVAEQLSSNIIVPPSLYPEIFQLMASDGTPAITNPNHGLAATSSNNSLIVFSSPQSSCTEVSPTLPILHKAQHMVDQTAMSRSANLNQAVRVKDLGLTCALGNRIVHDPGSNHIQQTVLSQNRTRLIKKEHFYLIHPNSDHKNSLILSPSSSTRVQPFVLTAANGQTFLLQSNPFSLEHSTQYLLSSDSAAGNGDIDLYDADVEIMGENISH
ncbi:unnamed protein product [Lymnaea stagnalis]|uniref:C2H2-type domain-containing protein n=1 Tax=Lymnaea stagnalis TaxID=6523 RepID=A0AAV2IAM9_LYMST